MKRVLSAVAVALLLAACNRGAATADPAQLAKAAADAKAYMDTNAKAPGVQTLPSGVQYKIVRSGPATGLKPGPNDEVKGLRRGGSALRRPGGDRRPAGRRRGRR